MSPVMLCYAIAKKMYVAPLVFHVASVVNVNPDDSGSTPSLKVTSADVVLR
jgi:hypothetical protein